MGHTTAIIDGLLVWATIKRYPRMIRPLINVELGLCHHFVKVFLKGAISGRGRLETNIIGGVPPSPSLGCLHLSSIELAILCDLASCRCVLGSSNSPPLAHVRNVRRGWLRIAVCVNIVNGVFLNKLSEPAMRIDARVRDCC